MLQVYNSPAFHGGFFDVFDQFHRLQLQRQAELCAMRKQVFLKQVEDDQTHQIQMFKRVGNFGSYEIKIVQRANEYLLRISSDKDNFERVFALDPNYVDLEGIDFHHFKDNGVLIINIPRIGSRAESVDKAQRKQERQRARELRRQARVQRRLRRLERHARKNRADTVVELNNPAAVAEFDPGEARHLESDSEISTPDASEEEDVVPVRPKHTPLLEEVEDEEFITLRKKFST